jgi:hypothetical protein
VENPLVALQRQVGDRDRMVDPNARDHLRHVCVDVRVAERARDRHAVVAVTHEVDLADLDQVHRRQRLASPHRGGDLLPAAADPGGGGAEVAVEVAPAVDRADDR